MNQCTSVKGIVTEKVLNFVCFKNFVATKDASESQILIGTLFAAETRQSGHGNKA
jgi:hypothetical protein